MSMKRDCLKLAGVAAAVLILVAAVATFTPIKPARAMGPGVGGVTSYNPGGGVSLSGTNTWTGPQTFTQDINAAGKKVFCSRVVGANGWKLNVDGFGNVAVLNSVDAVTTYFVDARTYVPAIGIGGNVGSTAPNAGLDASVANVLEVNTGTLSGAAAVQLNTFTVATLPGTTKGRVASVSDALAPVIGNAVSGGGAAFALVVYNGAQWTVIGK